MIKHKNGSQMNCDNNTSKIEKKKYWKGQGNLSVRKSGHHVETNSEFCLKQKEKCTYMHMVDKLMQTATK